MKRRTFIKKSSAALAAGMIFPKISSAFPKDKMIGIQLYTIRDLVSKDLEGTLKTLSKIGYRSVEAAGYHDRKFYGLTPREYKKLVESYGIKPMSTHSKFSLANADIVIEDTLEAGMKFIFIPYLSGEERKTLDQYKKLANEYNKIGEKCRSAGLTFGYHNHDFEFYKIEDEIPYDILLNRTDPEYVSMQLDLYWIVYAGYSPIDYFKNYPGRFASWHVKDMEKGDKKESTEIGNGIIDFEEIFNQKQKAGLACYFVEQEAFKIHPIESITQSYQYLKSLKNT